VKEALTTTSTLYNCPVWVRKNKWWLSGRKAMLLLLTQEHLYLGYMENIKKGFFQLPLSRIESVNKAGWGFLRAIEIIYRWESKQHKLYLTPFLQHDIKSLEELESELRRNLIIP